MVDDDRAGGNGGLPPPHSASAASALSALALDDTSDDVAGGDYRSNGEQQQQQQQRPPSASGAAPAASAPPPGAAAAAAAAAATSSAQGLDLTGAAISASAPAVGDLSSSVDRSEREAPAIVLPHQRGERVGHIALDIGGSLIKLVYFSPSADAAGGEGSSSSVEGGGQGTEQQQQGARPRSASASERASAAGSAAAAVPGSPAAAAAGERATTTSQQQPKSSPSRPRPPRGGKLHFVKFETSKIDECLDFIEAKGLHRPQQQGMGMGGFYGSSGLAERRSSGSVSGGGGGGSSGGDNKNASDPPTRVRVLATGGGAYRFADLFRSRLGVILEKEDEMDCLVAGADFLLRAVRHEAFTFLDGTVRYHRPGSRSSSNSSAAAAPSSSSASEQQRPGAASSSSSASLDDPYPYLLVNIGSGVSMVRVDGPGDREHARVSGSSLGGGTFWGLCRLLTGARSFDEMLELSSRGDNTKVDMLVGDIYGKDRDYSAIGLAASTIASSFGKAAAADLDLECYDRADLAMALCRMVSYNIGHLAYLNAKRYGLSRVFFGGFFIRGHPYTMETISYAIRFWSRGEMEASFLRHEGFLGAVGAFLKVHPLPSPGGGPAASSTSAAAAAAAAGAADGSTRGGRPPSAEQRGVPTPPTFSLATGGSGERPKFVPRPPSPAAPARRSAVAASPFAEGAHVEGEEDEDEEEGRGQEKGGAAVSAKAEAAAAVPPPPLAPISTTTARPSSASLLPPASESNNSNSNRAATATTPAAAVAAASRSSAPARVRSRFVERFSMGAPFAGGVVVGPAIESVEDRVSWVEQFLEWSGSGDGGGEGAGAGKEKAKEHGDDDEAVARAEAAAEAAEAAAAAAAAAASRGSGTASSSSPSSRPPLAPPPAQQQRQQQQQHLQPLPAPTTLPPSSSSSLGLHVGVLHFSPGLEPFPLLADPAGYAPDTLDVAADRRELDYWLGVLRDQVPQVVEKAVSSENAARREEMQQRRRRSRGGEEEEAKDDAAAADADASDEDDASAVEATRRRGAAMGRALAAHLARLHADPTAYGALALSDVFELREECLREFGFADVYALDKARENAAALAALPGVLAELDAAEAPPPLLRLAQRRWRERTEGGGGGAAAAGIEDQGEKTSTTIDPESAVRRLEALVAGSLAANIFDWGARACVELYEKRGGSGGGEGGGGGDSGSNNVLEMYRGAREGLRSLRRPWRVDTFDELAAVWRRAAAENRARAEGAGGEGSGNNLSSLSPPKPPFKRAIVFVDNAGADVVLGILPLARELLAWGCDVVLAANAAPAINDVTERELRAVVAEAAGFSSPSSSSSGRSPSSCCCPLLAAAAAAGEAAEAAAGGRIPPVSGLRARVPSVGSRLFDLGGGSEGGAAAAAAAAARPSSTSPPPPPLVPSPPPPFARSPDASPPASPDSNRSAASFPPAPHLPGVGRLFVCSNGQGSPCLDLRRVPCALADACVGADLVVVEGMGRAIHTNFRARFRGASSLKLAMIKNAHLAEALLGGEIMDCVCLFEEGLEE